MLCGFLVKHLIIISKIKHTSISQSEMLGDGKSSGQSMTVGVAIRLSQWTMLIQHFHTSMKIFHGMQKQMIDSVSN